MVLNASQVKLTGNKLEAKEYYRYSGYVGGLKVKTAGQLLKEHPERIIQLAVRRMLPKTKLGRRMFAKLKVYAGAEHPHVAQNPETITL